MLQDLKVRRRCSGYFLLERARRQTLRLRMWKKAKEGLKMMSVLVKKIDGEGKGLGLEGER